MYKIVTILANITLTTTGPGLKLQIWQHRYSNIADSPRGGPTDTGGPFTLGKNSGWLVRRTTRPRAYGPGDHSGGGTNHPPTPEM